MTHIEQFWDLFIQETAQAENVTFTEAFSFGYGEQMADSLAQLVLQGKKIATCCRYIEGDELAQPGELSIVLDGKGQPVCVVESIETVIIPYSKVDWELAKLEGEDETLESWQKNHREFFENEGKRKGFSFNENMLLCFEKFKVIYKGKEKMKFNNVYFINGTAYAGKSTLVKKLAEKYNGIACEENYHDNWEGELDKEEFPGLTYTRDLQDWHDFVRRTPDEYEAWINQTSWECEKLELLILEKLVQDEKEKPIFVDTNVHIETLKKIVPNNHVLIMLADPEISVKRFFERPDREKQFLYRLMLEEENPDKALENFRQCLARINSQDNYNMFLNSGFHVLFRDENRSIEETVALAAKHFGLDE